MMNDVIIYMLVKQKMSFDELESSNEEKPFIGRYHGVLRRRTTNPDELKKIEKPEYKKKKVGKKMVFWMNYVYKIEKPISINHVYNFHNILAINENSLCDPECEQSFITSKFYMKKINKVTIQQKCLLLTLENLENESMPIPYICQRLRSKGDTRFAQIAEAIELLEMSFPDMQEKLNKDLALSDESLHSFLQEMSSKSILSQYSPNLLIISSSFLNMLGYDVEEMAVESVKYKTIIKEFFSAASYAQIIRKHLQNIELIKKYMEGKISIQDFCSQSLIECTDYILNRQNVKIKCKFIGGASPQLTPYLQIRELTSDQEEVNTSHQKLLGHQKKMQQMKEAFNSKEMALLKKITTVPQQMDPSNKSRICSYKEIKQTESN